MTRTERDIAILNELFDDFLKTSSNPFPKFRGSHEKRTKVTDTDLNCSFRALCNCEAAYRVYYSNGGNAYNKFIANDFLKIVKENQKLFK